LDLSLIFFRANEGKTMVRFPIQYACNSQVTILDALGLALYLTIFASQEEREADQVGLAEFKRRKHA